VVGEGDGADRMKRETVQGIFPLKGRLASGVQTRFGGEQTMRPGEEERQ